MFKHLNCGGIHETVLQARECESNAKFAAETEASHAHFLRTGRDEDAPAEAFLAQKPNTAQSAILDSMRKPQAPSPSMPTSHVRVATPAQLSFLKTLIAERDYSETTNSTLRTVQRVDTHVTSFNDAHSAIGELKGCPKAAAVKAEKTAHSQPWRALSEKVPAGNYCVSIDGKNHFYRVSVGSKGFYKLQERASEQLHYVTLNRYAGILGSILTVGIEEARLRYSRELGRCWHCHLALTDNTQPHFPRGLGPKCGEDN